MVAGGEAIDFNVVIPRQDRAIEAALRRKIDGKTKPLGALGRLESLALQIGRIQQSLSPRLNRPQILLFAGDHGAVAEGISAYPQDVTWQMVHNFLAGGAAINVFTRQADITVQVVDAGVNHVFSGASVPRDFKIAMGTANYVREPAMSAAQCRQALQAGASLVGECAAQASTVIGFGEMGIGNTASAALLMHRVGGAPLAECVGSGAGLDEPGVARKLAVLERASARCSQVLAPLEALRQYGGYEIAMMTGAFLAAAEARMVLLVDGFIASAAALVAIRMYPEVFEYCVFTHVSAEAGHRRLLALLGADPILDLGMRLGEGSGAAVCYPILRSAVGFLNDMASFADAGVSGRAAD